MTRLLLLAASHLSMSAESNPSSTIPQERINRGKARPAGQAVDPATGFERSTFARRSKDWTLGPIIYQIFVDRFNRSASSPARLDLRPWSQAARGGTFLTDKGVWSHEIDFWGGNLKGITEKLDYIEDLGAESVYLTPIFKASTNHKYDTQDYFSLDPEFGTDADFDGLRDSLHKRNMKLMLDGVFNHIGRKSPLFEAAFQDKNNPRREWFIFGRQSKRNPYRAFADVPSLPAWNLENPEVRQYLWGSKDSVVQHWLKRGIDGWRLDVAFELGPDYLLELTQAAHKARPGSPVIGEVSGYPSEWFPAIDGSFNFFAMDMAKGLVKGEISGPQMADSLDDMVADAPYENLLKSWLVTDNHDTSRLATEVPAAEDRHLVQALQFTLPGAPVIYYGTELGMEGQGDPGTRSPMRWDLTTSANPHLTWIKKLVALRKSHPALRFGDYRSLRTQKLLAFSRTTDRLRQGVIVVVNPTSSPITETFATRFGQVMSWGELHDVLSGEKIRSITGRVTVAMKPKSVRIYEVVDDSTSMGYSQYGRIKE